jgi:hypothetical protein
MLAGKFTLEPLDAFLALSHQGYATITIEVCYELRIF